jgi:pimeloyl-ACP methyl ester carboxylesterase
VTQAWDDDKRIEKLRSADGTEIALTVRGEGPPLLLVHGALADHNLWNAISPFLRDHFTLYAMARRGRGESGDAPTYAPEREVRDIEAALRHIGRPAWLAGHSSGALLGLMASQAGVPLQGMILYEPPLILEGLRDPYPRDLYERVAEVARRDPDSAVRTFLREGPLWPEDEIDFLAQSPRWAALLRMAHTAAYDAQVVGTYRFEPAELARIDVPVLVLTGELSPAWYRGAAQSLVEALPRGEMQTVAGQTHMGVVTGPQLVAGAVLRFAGGG